MICLKKYSQHSEPTTLTLVLKERLPVWIQSPCSIECCFFVQKISDYYLLKFTLHGQMSVVCQRCLENVIVEYAYAGEIALCRTDSRADALMSTYDSIVVEDDILDLESVMVDELHLSSPQVPHETCQSNL